tara:strand:- start:581 stop:943 length:363 start_codon:yes stop_codon:yes gene_type:complete
MATTVSPSKTPLASTMVVITGLTNAAQTDLLGGSVTLGTLFIKNGSGGTAYLKIYDDAAPVVGTTEPDIIIEVANGKTVSWWIDGGLPLHNAISLCASDTPGKAAGSTASSFNVRVGLSS